MTTRPNIVVVLVDNLGHGELGCYGGGVLRGADTARLDRFAGEGTRLLNFAPEAQCTPSRSALLTGRYSIRSGTYRIPAHAPDYGLVAWERTLPDILSEQGYACGLAGKWHVGEGDGRWPTDRGFDEWYGPPRSYDEALWSEDPFYDPERDPVPYMLESTRGGPVRPGERLTMEVRRDVDREYERRAFDFMRRAVADDTPFFLLYCHSMMHLPTVPREEFRGRSASGDWGDCLLEMDHDFGAVLDELERLGVADDTVVVFVGDNGPEESLPWRGSGGMWEGSYFTGAEASLRTPCLVRWPGHVAAGAVSNEIVHITDLFPTILGWAGAPVPDDRTIDGADQRAFLEGRSDTSARDSFLFWNSDVLYGVKWRDWKVTYVEQQGMWDPVVQLAMPKLVNLLLDPKERENVLIHHTWVMAHIARIRREFAESVAKEPLIPFGAPLTHVPGGG